MASQYHLLLAEKLLEYRSDPKFVAGLEMLRRAEHAKQSGQVKDYSVLYCEDDPAVVHTIVIQKPESA